jgi:hypothetical protein
VNSKSQKNTPNLKESLKTYHTLALFSTAAEWLEALPSNGPQ